jgi:hypothetical protein
VDFLDKIAQAFYEVGVRYGSIDLVHAVNDYHIEDEMLVVPEGIACLGFKRGGLSPGEGNRFSV